MGTLSRGIREANGHSLLLQIHQSLFTRESPRTMPPRARVAKPSISPSKSKKNSASLRKTIRNNTSVEQSSLTPILKNKKCTPPRQKRLSSLTAATLLQYCTSILSPARKLKSTSIKTADVKTNHSRKRRISDVSEKQSKLYIPTRTRREASSHASAMIMQQNEIERSCYNYSLANEHSTAASIPKSRSKTTVTTKNDTPSVTEKYPSLTEAILAEHNHLQEMSTSKNDNLFKWTQELASCGRFSPPYPQDEIPPELPTIEERIPSVAIPTPSLEHSASRDTVPAPTYLFASSARPLDLRSFYPLLPCWQLPTWPFPLSTHPKKSFKLDSIARTEKQKNEALTFHLHTHYHHIRRSKSSLLMTIPSSSKKPSVLVNKNQILLPSTADNAVKKEESSMLPMIQNDVLNLSKNHKSNANGGIKKTTRRKSSSVKTRINSDPETNLQIEPTHSSVGDERSLRRLPKRRTVSATNLSTPNRISRGKRTISATVRKRSYSPASISLPLSKNHRRKKQKFLHHWILFGKFEQKLVSINADQPPVFRQCYSSIKHITEKDVIKSNDCVILRSEPGDEHGATPYLAKVKWFWEEPATGEIQTSLIWYYHPEHTELPLRVRERFLPNELLASRYWDCVSVACIEDKCYVLNFNEYNRYSLREKFVNLFENSDAVGRLKFLLNKNTSTVHHRPLPAKNVGNQNIFFCRYVYDYRVKRILKNPTLS